MKVYLTTQLTLAIVAHLSGGIVSCCAVLLMLIVFFGWNFVDSWFFAKV